MQKIAGTATSTTFGVVTHALCYLDQNMQKDKLDLALRWLVRNGQTGDTFYWLIKGTCKESYLELVRFLIAKIENGDARALIYKQDLI
jgi:hypothetical protein